MKQTKWGKKQNKSNIKAASSVRQSEQQNYPCKLFSETGVKGKKLFRVLLAGLFGLKYDMGYPKGLYSVC